METHAITEYNETLVTTIDLPERLTRAMEIFDLFLSFLTKEHPEGASQVMAKLETCLKEKTREPLDDTLRVEVEAFPGPLRNHPKHAELAQRAILTWMQYSNYKDQENLTSLRVFFRDFLRGFQFFSYWLAQSMTAIMSKSEAIEFYKRYIDFRIPITETGIKIADFNLGYEFLKQFLSTGTHVATLFKLKEGIIGTKITRCMGAEVLEELEDPELSYVIVCYGDFAAVKEHNENFRLTRTQTIVEGKPYCDFCYHDIRVDPTLKHPSKKFYDSL